MCGVCGCGGQDARIDGASGTAAPAGHHAHPHHEHDHDHGQHGRAPTGPEGAGHVARAGDRPGEHGPDGAPTADAGVETRLVAVEAAILARNDALAAANRARLAETSTLALDLVAAPGAGKTTLLVATIAAIGDAYPVAVVEGDQQTTHDADRIRAAGAPAVQVNTGRGCHLDAAMVGRALDRLPLGPGGVLFVENVGNLVCPAAFDLGEAAKVVIVSVAEGEDKPLKYPDAFAAAGLVVISKTDIAAACGADVDRLATNARRVNPLAPVLRVSARTGEGMEAWLGWLAARRGAIRGAPAAPDPATTAAAG